MSFDGRVAESSRVPHNDFLQLWLTRMIWTDVPVESECGVTGNIDLLHQAHFRLEKMQSLTIKTGLDTVMQLNANN
jgi:hypothetical protein